MSCTCVFAFLKVKSILDNKIKDLSWSKFRLKEQKCTNNMTKHFEIENVNTKYNFNILLFF